MADKIQDCAVNSTRWLSLENFEGEVWKDVDGYEGGYQVSNLGRAKSLRRRILIKSKIGTPSYRDYGERILQAHDNQKGYLYVNIGGRNGEQIYIHRLVAKPLFQTQMESRKLTMRIQTAKTIGLLI